jgi:hypothetical protein
MKIQHSLAIVLLAAAAAALAPAAAHAQIPGLNLMQEAPKDPETEERRAKIDEAYRNAQKKKAASQPAPAVDPWGTIRPAEPAKPAAPPKKQAGAKEK